MNDKGFLALKYVLIYLAINSPTIITLKFQIFIK